MAAGGGVPEARDRGSSKKLFDFFFQIRSQMAQAVESKSWPGRTEALLHYRMIGALPEKPHVHNPSRRVTPTLVVGHRWLLQECGNVAQFPIVESIM